MSVKTLDSREDPLFSPFVIADNLILLRIFSISRKPPAAANSEPEKLILLLDYYIDEANKIDNSILWKPDVSTRVRDAKKEVSNEGRRT